MISKVKKSVIAIFIVGLLVEIVREVSGSGLVGVINCSKNFYLRRCVGYENNSPITLMHDFFTFQAEKKIRMAWNLLSPDQQYGFTHVKGAKRDRNYFYNFWDREISDFVIFKSSYERLHEKTADIEFKICYLRDDIYIAKYKEKNFSKRFCSYDKYTLIRKKNESSPYKWSIDTMEYNKCSVDDIRICNSYNFDKKYIHFSE